MGSYLGGAGVIFSALQEQMREEEAALEQEQREIEEIFEDEEIADAMEEWDKHKEEKVIFTA
jgi:hypothetical protein